MMSLPIVVVLQQRAIALPRNGLLSPGNVIAGRVQLDPVQALIDRDVEHVFHIADTEVDVAGVPDWLTGPGLGIRRHDEAHFAAGGVNHEDPGATWRSGGEIDASLGIDGHAVAAFLVAKVDERLSRA